MAENYRKINLLIITQKVDINDPILGFFHRWLEEFAKHCEKLTVICLQKGEYDLPQNVRVLSLGKENGESRIKYILNFYKYIWEERKNYDSVFVHMNQEYVVLGGVFWGTFGKKIMMWRNHPEPSIWARLAVLLSNKVFCTSKESFTARFKKTTIMPVGIDTLFFVRKNEIIKIPNSILFLGRISPLKKPEIFVEALNLLAQGGVNFSASMVGDPLPRDAAYYREIRDLVKKYNLEDKIIFEKGITNRKTVEYYNTYDVYVNATVSGSLDKTIFEAMSCECLVAVSNKSLRGEISEEFVFEEGSATSLRDKLQDILNKTNQEKKAAGEDLRRYVMENHSLSALVGKVLDFS